MNFHSKCPRLTVKNARHLLARIFLALDLFLLLGLVPAWVILAAPGDLDTTFDVDGKVTTDFDGGDDQGWAVAIQPDGKIVVAGRANFDSTDFAVARYNADGSLDTDFDADGLAATDFANGTDRGYAVVLQPDNKIVVAGSANTGDTNDFALARYNADGSLDTTFGVSGTVTTDLVSGSDRGYAVVLQPDGKIVVAGSATAGNTDFALARYNDDGSLDTTFGISGTVTTDLASGDDNGYDVALQSDGKIVVAGIANIGGYFDFALVRYNDDGSLDTTFDADGKVTTNVGTGDDVGLAVAIQPDGKIVLAGSALMHDSGADFALARYNDDGSLDTTFGISGTVTTDIAGDSDTGRATVLQLDGKILVAGEVFGDGDFDFALARYNDDGSLDTTFGVSGTVTTDLASGDDQGRAMAIQSDGKIVVAGYAYIGFSNDLALARYENNGFLQIVTVTPSNGATDVALTAPVVVTFSEAVSTSTFAYIVTPDPGGWSAAWSGGDTVVTLDHAPFTSQTTYTVTITAAADAVGNPLASAPYAWHFTTVSYRLYLPLIMK